MFSPLSQKNFVCTKTEKSHWVDLFVPENSIKIVLRLVGYFLLKPLMNEPFVSETWLPVLGAVWVCLYVDIFACMCICECKRCTPLPRFCRHFSWRKGQSEEWMKLEGGKEREERRGTFQVTSIHSRSISLRWNSSWLGSLLEEPFIYWKEREINKTKWTTQNKA